MGPQNRLLVLMLIGILVLFESTQQGKVCIMSAIHNPYIIIRVTMQECMRMHSTSLALLDYV